MSATQEEALCPGYEALLVNLIGTGTGLPAGRRDIAFLAPGTDHSLQAIGDEPVSSIFAEVH